LNALAIHADQRYQQMSDFAQALRAPAFTAHSEKTVAMAPAIVQASQSPGTQTVVANRPTPSNPALPVTPPYVYTGVQPVQPVQASFPQPQNVARKKGARSTQQKKQQSQPYRVANYPVLPPGGSALRYGNPPQVQSMAPSYQANRRLPGSFNQGCLWGLLQGIGAALIVWFLKQEVDFYLALLVGLIGYLSAGFATTRRGGNFFRGASAGYWAGVTSLVLFGTTLGILMMIAFSQELHTLTAGSDFFNQQMGVATQSAWNAIQPMWPSLTLLPNQPPVVNFVVLLFAIVFIAWLLGLIGGIMGSLKNAAHIASRQQQVPHP
jgi:hypothetical protein